MAASVCGVLAAGWGHGVRRRSPVVFAYPAGAAASLLRAIGGLPKAVAATGAVLVRSLARPVAGDARDAPFAHGRRLDPVAAGRRAAVVFGGCVSPDSFVLRTPEQQDMVVMHGLGATAGRRDAQWPV